MKIYTSYALILNPIINWGDITKLQGQILFAKGGECSSGVCRCVTQG